MLSRLPLISETGMSVREVNIKMSRVSCLSLPSPPSMFHYTGQKIQRKLESRIQIEHSAVAQHIVSLGIVGGYLSKIN